jgi:hypothetical protein
MSEACMSDDFLTGYVKVEVELLRKAKGWHRDFAFTPEAILKEMDLSGAELNLNRTELLRRVERDVINIVLPELEKHRLNGILPSRGTISRCTREVHLFADEDITIEQFQAESGEGWVFKSLAETTKNNLCRRGLESTAKNRSVQVSLAIDAAPITKLLSLFSIALVITDRAAKCPQTGKPLGLHTIEGKSTLTQYLISYLVASFTHLINCYVWIASADKSQYRDPVYTLVQILGKETKKKVEVFEKVFDFFKLALPQCSILISLFYLP